MGSAKGILRDFVTFVHGTKELYQSETLAILTENRLVPNKLIHLNIKQIFISIKGSVRS